MSGRSWREGSRRGWCVALLLIVLAGCGDSASRDPVPTLHPELAGRPSTASAAVRAATLGATATAIAGGTKPATPDFNPITPRPAVASAAATPVLPASPTRVDVPKEGTPSSIPGATGQLIFVGERRLWIACRGEGSPTVVMDAGVNSGSQVWSLVWPATASMTRVCVYDRAGLGYSDPIPRPRTSEEIVEDLHALLGNANIPGPYVLVAHSFGGLNIRLYASRHPVEVVGLVLVDAVHEDRFAATAKVLTPAQQAEFERARQANPEGLDYVESSRLVREIGLALPDLPIVVIARGREESWPRGWPVAELERVWRELQRDLATRARQGTLIIAERSDHQIPGYQPELVVEATRRVVIAARAQSR